MSSHRLAVASQSPIFINTSPPFSNFDFVDNLFGDRPAIRRILSQARSYGCQTMIIEDIPAKGILAEDNAEISDLFSAFRPGGLKRLSFWKASLSSSENVSEANPDSLLGYAILKQDFSNWYVFESVIIKYPHKHNCVHGANEFRVRIADSIFSVRGVLYCQQNGFNKSCAQVALRSLLATRDPFQDISYRQINCWAGVKEPGRGLSVPQMQKVLKNYGIGFYNVDYQQAGLTTEEREKLPSLSETCLCWNRVWWRRTSGFSA